MKQCPKCSRIYADGQLNFCLDDGEWLVTPNAVEEPPTAILSGDQPSDARTARQVTITNDPEPLAVDAVRTNRVRSRSSMLIIAGSVVLAIALIGFGAYRYAVGKRPAAQLSFEKAKLTRLTTTGKATNVAISPDGKTVVHVQDDGGQQSLWIRQTATQSNVQIQPPSPVSYDGLVFSPDGNFIYYTLSGQQYPQRVLFQIPIFGGSPKRILDDLDVDTPSFSPDGKQFLFQRNVPEVEGAIYVADIDGSNQRKLLAVKSPPESVGWMSWSPDGKTIAYSRRSYETNDSAVFTFNLADGSTKQVGSQRWFRIVGLRWVSDGQSLFLLATPQNQFVYQIWQITYPDGEAHQLTNDLDDYEWFSATSDSRTIAAVKQTTRANLWTAPLSDPNRIQQATSGSGITDTHVTWTPDGRLLYTSNASGIDDIWITNSDGSGAPKQLTSGSRVNRLPVASPDGRYIVFLSDRSGTPHLWRMNMDGGDLRQLTNGELGEQGAQFSPDGRWIYYMTAQNTRRTSWKILADGSGPAIRLTDKEAGWPTVSPDGKFVAYFYRESDDSPSLIAVASSEGGGPIKTFELPPTFERRLKWMPDSRGIAYIDTKNGVTNIVVQPLEGGKPRPLTDFRSDRILAFDFSRDGKELAMARGEISNDVILISGF